MFLWKAERKLAHACVGKWRQPQISQDGGRLSLSHYGASEAPSQQPSRYLHCAADHGQSQLISTGKIRVPILMTEENKSVKRLMTFVVVAKTFTATLAVINNFHRNGSLSSLWRVILLLRVLSAFLRRGNARARLRNREHRTPRWTFRFVHFGRPRKELKPT